MGLTSLQMLRQVELPMATPTIVVGINQCTMAALSMATIAALMNGPGLGKPRRGRPADPERRCCVRRRSRDRGDGDHARPHHHRGQRADDRADQCRLRQRPERDDDRGRPRATPPMGHRGGRPRSADSPRHDRGALAAPRRPARAGGPPWSPSRFRIDYAKFPDITDTPVLKRISGPEPTNRINDFTTWFIDKFGTFTTRGEGRLHQLAAQPAAGPIAESPWWLDGAVLADHRLRARRLASGRDDIVVCQAGHLRHRSLARRDDHARHDARRHRSW